ncbi:MAG: hypothetical protein U0Q12_19985 [Vicinamibacterales bacterium]
MTTRRHWLAFGLAACSSFGSFAFSSPDDLGERTSSSVQTGTYEQPVLGEEYFQVGRRSATEEQEIDAFRGLANDIARLQQQVFEKHRRENGDIRRGFHAKDHGCFVGEMNVLDEEGFRSRFAALYPSRVSATDLGATYRRLQQGLFKGAGSYPVLARFSNGRGFDEDDHKPEVRGLAFKVLGRWDGSPLDPTDPQVTTQDFLTTDMPVPMGDDGYEFMEFAKSEVSIAKRLDILVSHRQIAARLKEVFTSKRNQASLAVQKYWAGAPYRLGPGQAVKFILLPSPLDPAAMAARTTKHEPDYFRADLRERIQRGDIVFDYVVQFQTDPVRTPVEHALTEWTEDDAPPFPIAEVRLHKGQTVDEKSAASARNLFCESVSLTPWHTLAAHKPMGNLGRARLWVYDASVKHRSKADAGGAARPDPTRAGVGVADPVTLAEVRRIFGDFGPRGKP